MLEGDQASRRRNGSAEGDGRTNREKQGESYQLSDTHKLWMVPKKRDSQQ